MITTVCETDILKALTFIHKPQPTKLPMSVDILHSDLAWLFLHKVRTPMVPNFTQWKPRITATGFNQWSFNEGTLVG